MPGETVNRLRHPSWASSLTIAGALLTALALLALLSRLEIVSNASLRIDVAVAIVFLASAWYLVLDWRLGLAILGGSIVLYLIGVVLPLWLATALLIPGGAFILAGWVGRMRG